MCLPCLLPHGSGACSPERFALHVGGLWAYATAPLHDSTAPSCLLDRCCAAGDVNSVSIGDMTSVQDNVLIHVAKHNAAGKVGGPAARAAGGAATLQTPQLLRACWWRSCSPLLPQRQPDPQLLPIRASSSLSQSCLSWLPLRRRCRL